MLEIANWSSNTFLSNFFPSLPSSENSDNHCEPVKRTGSLRPFWAWLQEATYVGKMMQKHIELDLWEFSVS